MDTTPGTNSNKLLFQHHTHTTDHEPAQDQTQKSVRNTALQMTQLHDDGSPPAEQHHSSPNPNVERSVHPSVSDKALRRVASLNDLSTKLIAEGGVTDIQSGTTEIPRPNRVVRPEERVTISDKESITGMKELFSRLPKFLADFLSWQAVVEAV